MRLLFEDAWHRTIAPQDRLDIETIFAVNKKRATHPIVRIAHNHQKKLLVTTLVQNHSDKEMTFEKRQVTFQTPHAKRTQLFMTKSLVVPPFTSMPWTFIFDEALADCSNGEIIIATI